MDNVTQLPVPLKPKLLDRVRNEIRTRPGHILMSPCSAKSCLMKCQPEIRKGRKRGWR